MARPPVLDPPAQAEGAVIFDDEAHLRASHLLALARGRPAWFHADLESSAADPLAALAAPGRRDTAHAALLRLAREDVLAEVLAARPASAVAVFAAALCCDSSAPADVEADRSATPETRTAALRLLATAIHWPPLSPPAFSLAMRVHAALLLNARIDAPMSVALAAAASLHPPAGFVSPAPLHTGPSTHSQPSDRQAAIEPTVTEPPRPQPPQVPATQEPAETLAEVLATGCAGLFYLCDRLMELDVPESLWKACLPEREVLAAAAAALLGPRFADDPAPAMFGGATAKSCPPVTAEQHREIAIITGQALAAALPRRGLAAVPPATVSLIDSPGGRLLVAVAENSPFAFFAWPAATAKMAAAGLEALLAVWPHSAVLTASPALAGLDSSGRLRSMQEARRTDCLLPDAGSAPASALLATIIGAPCFLFAARTGAGTLDSAEAFVARFLALPGRILTTPEQINIVLPARNIVLEVRRAGLDRDPGWLPWLRRTVHFQFEEQ